MAFVDFPEQKQVVELLQRSLERGRLGHAYLFTGHQLSELEALARALAKVLNCERPVRRTPKGPAVDCCDNCASCRKIAADNHGDIHWVRPESKSRVVTVDQMRDLMQEIFLKPNDAEYKVAVIVAADRLNPQAANAFLKTLEEPPAKSVLILLTTEPQRLLETVVSRCLRLNFAGEGARLLNPAQMEWLSGFSDLAAAEQKSLLVRYRLLGALLKKLGELKEEIEKSLTARSPLERFDDVEPELRERWEKELTAAIEAEYRLQRSDLLLALQWWLRDVWMRTLSSAEFGVRAAELLNLPQLESAGKVAKRISARQAVENLRVMERTQRLLGSNVQEALALEVGLLKLNL
jgi:DNA polymerase-3 subunit delta'